MALVLFDEPYKAVVETPANVLEQPVELFDNPRE